MTLLTVNVQLSKVANVRNKRSSKDQTKDLGTTSEFYSPEKKASSIASCAKRVLLSMRDNMATDDLIFFIINHR